MMTCKYNISLEINSNWFLKINLGKQCCIHRLVVGILDGISAKSIINLSVKYSLALVRFGSKHWNYLFIRFHARWLRSCLQDPRALVGNLHILKLWCLPEIFFPYTSQRKRVSYVGFNYLLPKPGFKANDTFSPFQFHFYFENAFHVKKSSLFLFGVAQPF